MELNTGDITWGFNINDIANYANAGIPFDSVMANPAQCRLL